MKTPMIVSAAAVLAATTTIVAAQQSKTVTLKTETLTATVENIDPATRQVTVRKPDGTHEVFFVPTTVKRFDTLKVGDKITARHYENIVLRMQPPGSKDVDKTARDVATPAAGTGTAGTLAHQRTITATITAIDPKEPSVTFTGPNNFKFHTKVQDVNALSKVKVGDKVDITWTEATLVSIEDAK
jgi:aspartate carbamoyltransferase catalytic subunit